MNFTFTDISSTILSMTQSGPEPGVMSGANGQDTQNQLFAQQLGKILEKGKSVEDQGLSDIQPRSDDSIQSGSENSESLVDALAQKLDNKKGVTFLSALKNIFLMLSKGDLKNISIDAQGLETLKKILAKAGFESSDLEALMADLKATLEEKTVTMDDLFDKLFELPIDMESTLEVKPEQLIETSALPFLESILNALNIPPETVHEILTAADQGEKGISLDVIIERLQQLQKQAFYTQSSYQTKEGADQFNLLLKQLNLDTQPLKSSLTLNDLVTSFEKLRHTLSQKNNASSELNAITDQKSPGNENSADLLKDLFNGLQVQHTPKDKPVFEFSYHDVKNQFKNDLLNSENGKNGQKGLSDSPNIMKPTHAELIKEGLKQMVSELGEKPAQASTLKETIVDDKGHANRAKVRPTILTDQSQVSVIETKASHNQASQIMPKAKASFQTLPNFVTQQVSKSIVRAINQGENILKIQLKPPELGRLMLTIDHSGNSMKVSIMTENAAAKDILVANTPELRAVLSNSGVTLEQFNVDMNSDFRQSMADAKNQTSDFNKRQQNRGRQLLDPVTGDMMKDVRSLMEAIDQGESLHFVA